ncbi:helix-turn-helix domain-containing protein [Lacticaseibacillus jixiensis]|uniref:helix-turn-helix domain-containing protein n=1 Tax=Lacticaseibacillus jixiensis TaxID=3231926 RepID=UPI0036F29BFB
MRHGELIKKLRIERNLTQEQLSAGITSRNSLAAFERGGSSITFDNLVRYCNRLNITLEEYEYLYDSSLIDPRRELATRVSHGFKAPFDQSLADDLLARFEDTNDFYFYSLYAQYYLLNDLRCKAVLTDPKVPGIVEHLKNYLDSVYSWGRFELVLFTNCLFVFDDKYISFQFHESVESMWLAVNSSNHANDLLAFLINGSQLTFERHDEVLFCEFKSELAKVANTYHDVRASIALQVFQMLKQSRSGQDVTKIKRKILSALRTVDQQSWIEYIKENC